MKLVTFTIEEATRALAEIRPRMERLVPAKADLDALRSRIDVLKLAVAGASRENPDAQELQTLEGRHARLADAIAREIAAIHGYGCQVKDLDQGLVDFHALAGDRLVFLCWQLGEPEIRHWHTLDGGFASRQPLHQSELE